MQWQNNSLILMLRNLTLTSYLWIALGLGFGIFGAYLSYQWRYTGFRLLPMPLGIILVGLGMTLCGLTNGFTDHSPLGRQFKRIGAFSLIVGIAVTGYFAYSTGYLLN
jgi:hypothetical protein